MSPTHGMIHYAQYCLHNLFLVSVHGVTLSHPLKHQCDFFAILLIFFMQHSRTFHIWKCALDPENHAQYSHQPSPILSLIFFLILWLFYCYFSFSIAILSIFGNVHWTLNTMPNMVTNHPLFFSPFFSDFFAILLLFLL